MPRPPFTIRVVAFVFVALFALSVVGCGGDDPAPGGGGKTASSGESGGKATAGILRYPLTAEPTTLDPGVVSDGPTIDLLQNIHMGLVGWNDKNEVVPLVAEKYVVSNGGKTYTFMIKDNAKFHNGRAVTAEDVKYSITRSLDPKLASPVAMTYLNDIVGADAYNAGKAQDVPGIKVINSKTVAIKLTAPRPYFLGKLTYGTAYIVPKEEVEKGEKTEQGAFTIGPENAVGCGPFKLENYTRQSKATLVAFDDFFLGKPKLSRIERPIVLDSKTVRNMYNTGELDYITLEKGDYERDKDNADLKDEIKTWPRAATWYLGLNQTRYAPFKDKRVRQAVAHAVNKQDIVQGVLLGINKQAEGVLPEGVVGFDANLKGLPHDVEKAKQLLAQAGFPGGKNLPTLKLAFRESQPDVRKTAEVVKEQLAAIGMNVELNEMEWGAFLKATDNREIDFFHMRWSADYLDPQNFLSVLLMSKAPENRTAYNNPAYDALCARADAEPNSQKRLALYAQAEKMVVEDAPWVPIYFQRDLELMNPRVGGVRDSLLGHLPHITTTTQ